MRYTLSTVLFLTVLNACSKPVDASHTEEALDFANTLDRFAIAKTYSYDYLTQMAELKLPSVPWTDTYWPVVNKGLSWRYAMPDPDDTPPEELKLASYLSRFTTEAQKTKPDPLLSPAEKYDLVYQYRHNIPLPADALKSLATVIGQQDGAIQKSADLAAKRPLVSNVRSTLLQSSAEQALSMTLSGWSTFLGKSADASNQYLGDASNPGSDWSWEGHCHGWSPAAEMSFKPKHSVMAVAGDKQIFFSEGDLRGLMTKAWADSAPTGRGEYFLGRRCEASPDNTRAPIAANAAGKGYSGTLSVAGKDVPFVIIDSLPRLMNVNVSGRSANLNVYRIATDGAATKSLLVEDSYGGNTWTAPSMTALAKAVRTSSFSALQAVDATFTGCWDPNPAAFHEVLIEQLGVRKVGFVMDRTRTGQVWNQPIAEASFAIGPLLRRSSVADVADAYRAPGTVYLAEVIVQVGWSTEPPRPKFSYGEHFDANHVTHTTYSYTLEFDAAKRVIGGEWGSFSSMDPGPSGAPDFLFGYAKGSVPVDKIKTEAGTAHIDYSGLIGKLYECGQDDKVDGTETIEGYEFPYKSCVIDKAAP